MKRTTSMPAYIITSSSATWTTSSGSSTSARKRRRDQSCNSAYENYARIFILVISKQDFCRFQLYRKSNTIRFPMSFFKLPSFETSYYISHTSSSHRSPISMSSIHLFACNFL